MAQRTGVVLLAVCAACGTRTPKVATVQGDIYLVMKNGDVKRGAGNTVRLLPDTGAVQAAIAQACSTVKADQAVLFRQSKVLEDKAKHQAPDEALRTLTEASSILETAEPGFNHRYYFSLDSLLLPLILIETGTGMNGHYSFDHVRPGRYILWAETEISDHHYTWWAPLAVTRADSIKKDLDNSSLLDTEWWKQCHVS